MTNYGGTWIKEIFNKEHKENKIFKLKDSMKMVQEKTKNRLHDCSRLIVLGDVLLSQDPAVQVPSAL
ncbi:hypothetical protein, partial [Paenibacillus baekrokdamisoli]|uniref:hypothetical protein n=1 Tax=Paenibacillus baekrokdamisoli TaxID=1712516 RepID=UPI001C863DC7